MIISLFNARAESEVLPVGQTRHLMPVSHWYLHLDYQTTKDRAATVSFSDCSRRHWIPFCSPKMNISRPTRSTRPAATLFIAQPERQMRASLRAHSHESGSSEKQRLFKPACMDWIPLTLLRITLYPTSIQPKKSTQSTPK